MKTQLTAKDIHGDGEYPVGQFTIRVRTEQDCDVGAPWEECDGHGPVSEWTTRDKAPGERVLCSDRRSKRYYDFAAAVAEARRDGWDCAPYHAALPNETAGQQAARTAEADFEYLRSWANDEWHYLVLFVSLHGEDGEELACDSLGGVEGRGDYWKEQAAEMANVLLAKHDTETAERAYWEARDTVTA
jgi:hypothetical protein